MNVILGLVSAFMLSFILTPICGAIARRYKILDRHADGKMDIDATPLLGGAAICFAFASVVLFSLKELPGPYKALLIGSAIIFISGLFDDIRPCSSIARLITQLVATAVLVYGGIYFTFLPDTALGIATEIFLTFLWVVGMTNAFNYLDGLNGLLSGVAVINAVFFFIFTLLTGQTVLGYILMVFIGASLGFFPYNFFSGTIFMGNAGSAWMGFMLAGLSIIGEWATNNPIDLIIPVLIFGVPIFDMINTTFERTIGKKVKNMIELLDYKGKDHFHYRLSRLGLMDRGAVLFIFMVSIILGLNALLLAMSQDILSAGIILCIGALLFVLISLLIAASSRNKETLD